MATELESNVALSLVDSPGLVQTHQVDPKWFADPKLATLVGFIVEQRGDFSGFVEFRRRFTQANPTVMSDEDWRMFANSDSLKAEFPGYLSELRQVYLRRQVMQASQVAQFDPSDSNLADLKALIEKLSDPVEKPEMTLTDLGKQLDAKLESDVPDGILTYQAIDDMFNHGMHTGQLIVVGARPSVGKTAFGLNMILKAFRRNENMKIDLFSLEMQSSEVYQRMASTISDVRHDKFFNPKQAMTATERAKVRGAIDVIKDYDLGIHDNYMTLEEITRKIQRRAASSQPGHYLAVVDYLQLVTSANAKNVRDRRLEIEAISRQFKVLTSTLHIPILLFSQLSRAIESRENKAPVLSDLRETGAIEQDANVVGFLYRTDDPKDVDEIVFSLQKNREGALGKTTLNFYKPTQRMEAAM